MEIFVFFIIIRKLKLVKLLFEYLEYENYRLCLQYVCSVFLQKLLPPLRHVYIVPFIPSGFWPRLISRLLTDGSITSLARTGCGLAEDGEPYSVLCTS